MGFDCGRVRSAPPSIVHEPPSAPGAASAFQPRIVLPSNSSWKPALRSAGVSVLSCAAQTLMASSSRNLTAASDLLRDHERLAILAREQGVRLGIALTGERVRIEVQRAAQAIRNVRQMHQ